jgi:lipopolysaccharide transport system ATP-binding protein
MIRVQGVSKKFKIYATPADRLKEKLLRRPCHHEYAALSDISFEVQPGETLGIIGENGAGKSTLLKILSGVLLPDTGSVEVTGKVTGLLELGTGFNPELTGLQNIFMNGTFLGMTHDEIESKKETIIEFAELGDFINEPIKTYSSGMLMRLGFAIAIHADPECFLVDEALSVGDAYFQHKCMRKINEFKEQGGSIIFVSHDTNAILTLCDHAILLNQGNLVSYGLPSSITNLYLGMVCKKQHRGEQEVEFKSPDIIHEYDTSIHLTTGEIDIIKIEILDSNKSPVSHIHSRDNFSISLTFKTNREIENPTFGILISNRYGVSIYGINSYLLKKQFNSLLSGEKYTVNYYFEDIQLSPDEYLITLAIDNNGYSINSFDEYLVRLNNIAILKIIKNEDSPQYEGVVELSSQIEVYDIPT